MTVHVDDVRVRKAWEVSTTWSDGADVFYAPTGSKAKYQALLDLHDPLPDLTFKDLRVRRAKHRDVTLPKEHRLVAVLTPVERRLIAHAFGSQSRSPGFRDHYCTSPGNPDILRLVFEFGLFDGPHGRQDVYGEVTGWAGAFFYLTDLGKQVARSMLPDYPA